MAGLESDVRAGGVRVSPSELIGKASDLTPAVSLLSDAFRKGQLTAQEFIDRYDARGRAKAGAETAEAKLRTREVEEVGPLALEAKKAALDPRLIALKQQSEMGGLEGQVADQQFTKETRQIREKAERLKMARALDELEYGLPANLVQDYALQFPEIVKPTYDSAGRISNPEDVKKQLGHVARAQKFLQTASELSSQFETQKVTLEGGQEGVRTVWKGTSQPVPQELVNLANQARTGKLTGLFGAPGAMQTTTGAIAPLQSPTVIPPAAAPAAAVAPSAQFPVGTTTPEGVMITSPPGQGTAKPTEVESRANKFANRMELAESQYTQLLQKGVDPTTTGFQTQKDILNRAVKLPVVGPTIVAQISQDVKEYDQSTKAFTSAMLRDESGAAIRDEEREEYERTFFPVAGDSPQVVQNKAAQRAAATAALKQVATRKMSPEDYERYLTEVTGLQFPTVTSVQSEKAGITPPGTAAPTAAPAAAAPAKIPKFKSILDVPQNVKVFWIEGEAQPRRRL